MSEKLTLEWICKYYKARVFYSGRNNNFIIKIHNTSSEITVINEYAVKSLLSISDCKLILRPLSSLTDEEKQKMSDLVGLTFRELEKYLLGQESWGFTLQESDSICNELYQLNIDFHTPSLQERGIAVYE